jgi:hypothetical protein
MAVRSEERERFLADIICTAVEGGINFWAAVSVYKWDGLPPREWHAVVHRLKDDETDYVDAGLKLDIEAVARGVRLIIDGELVNTTMLKGIRAADKENDAAYIDSYDASAIVQAGLFGEVIYG